MNFLMKFNLLSFDIYSQNSFYMQSLQEEPSSSLWN